jgi:hypothetical protein
MLLQQIRKPSTHTTSNFVSTYRPNHPLAHLTTIDLSIWVAINRINTFLGMWHGQCFSLCSRGSTNKWNYVHASRNWVQPRLSTNLQLLYQCHHLFTATIRRNLHKELFWNCHNPENNILNSHHHENLKFLRKCVTSPSSSGRSANSMKTDKMYVQNVFLQIQLSTFTFL